MTSSTPPSPTPAEAELLIARVLAGDATPKEVGQLAALCKTHPAILETLAQHTLTERLLQTTLKDPHGTLFASEITLRLSPPPIVPFPPTPREDLPSRVHRSLRSQRWQQRLLQTAAALLCGGALLWTLSSNPAAARIERTEALGALSPIQSGRALQAGETLRFDAGFVSLRFQCGAQVLLEGPAELRIDDAWHGFLSKGRAVATVGRAARGFTLDGPGGRLVDLGTKFAVSVEPQKAMEVHVLEGLVEATAQGQNTPVRLTQNQALRLEGGTSEPLQTTDPSAFVTLLPPKSSAAPRFVHWSFEENSTRFLNRGNGLGGKNGQLQLHPAPGTPQTSALKGPFGNALSLQGNGTYAESPFRGIGGAAPRTVAFWVQVPSDFDPRQGYAIVSWGSRMQDGAAWQISINPVPEEGPVGRLRVGVNRGPVVGTTDLRDGRWHHCAVVLYGGPKADVSTHVLLYVDGILESALRKAVMPVQTDTESPLAHGIWIGRNLSITTNGKGPSFRGAIDEMFIFDSAMGQAEIQHLMQHNTPKRL
ncbi:MAG: hypothetical protein RLZZ142_1097 [Verrucomicrobiota bacterium]